MGLQVIYTNKLNVIGKWAPKDRIFKENPIKARRGQRDPVEENVLGLLNTGRKKKRERLRLQSRQSSVESQEELRGTDFCLADENPR